jgi:hypothetical protein
MRVPVRLPRRHKRVTAIRRLDRPSLAPTTNASSPDSFLPRALIEPHHASTSSGFASDPYVDYGRFLTNEGGVLITYKDVDTRWRQTLWRLLAWTAATGAEGWFQFDQIPDHSVSILVICFVAIAAFNWFIVRKPVEVYRRVEIRPDCLILEDAEVFWLAMMEGGWPAFKRDKDGNQVLSGIYGSRFVEYLTARRFDDMDRTPEVFASHLQEAMSQLWAPSLARGTVRAGSVRR